MLYKETEVFKPLVSERGESESGSRLTWKECYTEYKQLANFFNLKNKISQAPYTTSIKEPCYQLPYYAPTFIYARNYKKIIAIPYEYASSTSFDSLWGSHLLVIAITNYMLNTARTRPATS
jgi:hypothetical protein